MKSRARAVLDVVIPARGETATLAACLNGVLRDSTGVDLNVIIVANGPERAATLDVAKAFSQRFARAGVTLSILEDSRPSKPNALNYGDSQTRGGAVMYLDADVTILAGSLMPLAQALASQVEPILMSPAPRILRPRTWLARHFARVWATLPAVAGDVVGSGCFAVNAAGRDRWSRFPDALPDDSYVRSRFAKSERRLSRGGGFLVVLPEGRALAPTVRRWRRGNQALRMISPHTEPVSVGAVGADPGAGALRNLSHFAGCPGLWPYLPGFLLVHLLARLPEGRLGPGGGGPDVWLPARASSPPPLADESSDVPTLDGAHTEQDH